MRLFKLSEVKHMTGLGRSTFYNLMKDGTFPKSVPLGGRAVVWAESEVEEWVMVRIAERDSAVEV
ncbi:transcriptional regulator [Salinivibrio sp. IB574]|uniref:helix-turn-helix transcriptional regulator n=1 Tax=Salinivibrio sp. IB574 TaxID=1909444 RepID=UPI0009899CDB|nr:AlpA family transcriptional regulator [Salinivibrio sp. IB574]OOF22244.1 transcriptional regulator [Salinivibrio sp. IB574]